MVKDCPHKRGQDRGNTQPKPNTQDNTTFEPLKRNMFYALKGGEEQEKSADVVTAMLHVFSTSIYALLNIGSILFFVTLLLALIFELFLEVLHDPSVVSTPLGKNCKNS